MSRAVWACALVVLCTLVGCGDALFFHVTEGSQRCFIEEVRAAGCVCCLRASALRTGAGVPVRVAW